MTSGKQMPPITAIVYPEGEHADDLMREIADHLRARGLKLGGAVQLNQTRPWRPKCDMTLVDLSSGQEVRISEDRGPEARGCRLDVAALDQAMVMTTASLAAGPDLLLVNKFGKMEAAGRGFGPIIGDAIANGTPVLIAVPEANVAAWDAFAGDYSARHDLADLTGPISDICTRLGLTARC